MTGLSNQRVSLGQGNGSEVELIVNGTELYATYETLDGYPVVYDDRLELFVYARLVDGRYTSTGVPLTSPPPPGVHRHAKESDAVRSARIAERQSHMERTSGKSQAEGECDERDLR